MDYRYPLAGFCNEWQKLITGPAKDQRDEQFGKYAREVEKFYDSAHNWMWDEEYANRDHDGYLRKDGRVKMPAFMVTINKVSDAVDLYGPHMMSQYPQVLVGPAALAKVNPESLGLDIQNDQMSAQIWAQQEQERNVILAHRESTADIATTYLNWLQIESKKKTHARRSITQAIVAGLGLLYHELHYPKAGSIAYPKSRFIRWDQLYKDPDAETPEDVQWIAVEWTVPVNQAERKFNLPAGSLRGDKQSAKSQSTAQGKRDAKNNKKNSDSWDLITYWEVYSKNGFGDRLKNMKDCPDEVKALVQQWGDYTYCVIAEDIPYPLNLPTEVLATGDEDEIFERAHWPIPFYNDSGAGEDWPITELFFKENPNGKWPIAMFKPLVGEMRFVSWAMSFLADKVASSSTDYIGVVKAAVTDIQEQIANQRGPWSIIEIESQMGQRINDLISILPKPDFDVSLWNMVREVMEIIDKGSGVTELMYGQTSRQMRSAREADVLEGNSMIRTDEMAARSDEWYALSAKKEWQAAVWLLDAEDVQPILGTTGAWVFTNRIQTEEFDTVASDFTYRIVSGSSRKPDLAKRQRQLTDLMQVASPLWQFLMQLAITDPYNAFIEEMAKALEIQDYEKFMVDSQVMAQALQQQQAMAQQAQQSQQEGQEEESARFQAEQQRKNAELAQKLMFERAMQQSKLEGQTAQAQIELLSQQLELANQAKMNQIMQRRAASAGAA